MIANGMMRAMQWDLRRAACACIALGLAAAAGASGVRLDDLTSSEVAASIARGTTTVLVPVGGTEQSGAHIALGKHNRRVDVLSQRIAEALGDTLVAPVIAYVPEGSIDPPSGHMRYAGTISVPSDVFVRTLESAARSLRRHGFRDIVFLGDHGGYQRELRTAAEQLNREWAKSGVRAHALADYYRSADETFRNALVQRGFSNDEIGVHGGLADTSLMLAVDASFVRRDRLSLAHPGVDGNAARASPELGQVGVELIVSRSTEALRSALARR